MEENPAVLIAGAVTAKISCSFRKPPQIFAPAADRPGFFLK
jgi:hypothetical protein